MSIVLQFYPNGEFSQGVDTSRNRPPRCVRQPTQISTQTSEYTHADVQKCLEQSKSVPPQVYSQVGATFRSRNGQVYTLVSNAAERCGLTREGDSSGSNVVSPCANIYRLVHLGILIPLVHQSVESCETPKKRKKLESMSKRMSRNIRNAVYLLEKQKGGKDVLSFLTLTLPHLSAEGLKSCCENWDSMVKRFFDWMRSRLKKRAIPLQHVYCTEIQLKRLQRRGEYAPHLHVVFKGRATVKSSWAITPQEAREEWAKCIRAYTSEPFNTKALENLQRIKHSAARYLSKYLSKGSNIIPDGSQHSPVSNLRTQWGGMARSLSKGIRQATQRFTGLGSRGYIAWDIFNNIDRLVESGLILYFKRGFVPLDTSSTEGLEHGLHVGCGCLSTPTFEGGVVKIMSFVFG